MGGEEARLVQSHPPREDRHIGNVDTIFFDLDGTLADPKIGFTNCIQHALRSMNRPVPDSKDLIRHIGPPLRSTFGILLETGDSAVIEEAVRFFRERYNDVGVLEYEHYEGVKAMLGALAARPLGLYVVSSKAAAYLPVILRHLGVAGHFAGAFGPDLQGRLDNKTVLLAHVLHELRIDPSHSVMVGDRAVDIKAGKGNGTFTVAVTYGYGTIKELTAVAPDGVCATTAELTDLLCAI